MARERAADIENDHMQALGLVENGNYRGPVINYLSDIRGYFGNFFTTNQKGCRKFCLQLLMAMFSQYDLCPFGEIPNGFMAIYHLIYGLLHHQRNGGNFTDGTWRTTVSHITATKDPSSDPEIFRPLEDYRIIGLQNHVFVLKEGVTAEFYNTIVSSIAYNYKHMNPFVLKNLTRIVYLGHDHGQLSPAEIENIEDPNTNTKYTEYISAILESLQTALKDPILCISCVQGLPSEEQAVKHLDKFHGCVNKLNVAQGMDHRTQMLINKEKEKSERIQAELQARIASKDQELEAKEQLLAAALAEIARLTNN